MYFQCLWHCGSVLLCNTVSVCTIVAVFCCVILSVPLPICLSSFVWNCECLYQCGRALLCDTLCVRNMWRCSVVLYCQCLYQCCIAVLCDTVGDFTKMALPCCVKLWFPLPIWQYCVVWYCERLNQRDSACTNVTVPVPMWQRFYHGTRRYCVQWRLS